MVRDRILTEIKTFDVRNCDQTVEADKLLVHRYIIEMYTNLLQGDDQTFEQLTHEQVQKGLTDFSRLVTTDVHNFVKKSLKIDHFAVMAFCFTCTFCMFGWTITVLGVGFGTAYPLVTPDQAIEWAQDDSSRGTFEAVFSVCLVFGLIGLCSLHCE